MAIDWEDPRWNTWLAPVSASAIAGMTTVIGYGIYMAVVEDFGENISKKIFLICFFMFLFLACIYGCIGVYQLFFIELKHKFIVRRVENWDDFQVWGYYFKKDRFKKEEIVSVEEYMVKPRLGKNIITFLTYTCLNYKVTLKDGREFYFPGVLNDIEELKTRLEQNILKGTRG